ncbi:hypothetical protein GCM10023324_23900 [Streptomyces youssoufiensis]
MSVFYEAVWEPASLRPGRPGTENGERLRGNPHGRLPGSTTRAVPSGFLCDLCDGPLTSAREALAANT